MKKRPNILFLMSDQHRHDALGQYNPLIKTPCLDGLAREGIFFDRAFCNAPMCIPSRYSLMTGLYPSQHGVRNNGQMCPGDETLPWKVLPQRLNDLGYLTGGFGKVHWYSQPNPQFERITSTRGFEVRAQHFGYARKVNEPGAVLAEDDIPEAFTKLNEEYSRWGIGGESAEGYIGDVSEVPEEKQLAAWLTDKALDFLDEGKGEERPFFLYLSFSFPHAPGLIPPGYDDLYNPDEIDLDLEEFPLSYPVVTHSRPWPGYEDWLEKTPEERKRAVLRYYTNIHLVDRQFTRVIKRLKETGEYENTLILFASDHGEMMGERNRFSKYCMYEASVKIPLILSGGALPKEKRGTRSGRLVSLVDVLPTLVEAAGGRPPQEAPGETLLSQNPRAGTFCEMHGYGKKEPEAGPVYMWRTEEWKLILHIPGNGEGCLYRIDETRGELYHLADDPGERENLYGKADCLAKREEMTRQLLMHLACCWGKYPHPTAN